MSYILSPYFFFFDFIFTHKISIGFGHEFRHEYKFFSGVFIEWEELRKGKSMAGNFTNIEARNIL